MHYINISFTKSLKSKILRSFSPSPTPKNLTGFFNSETIIRIQKENNMAVFLTTHYMEEALNADYIVILNKGNIIATGTPSYLRESFSTNNF